MWPLVYLVLFAESLAAGLILVPVAARLGLRWGMADKPGPRKIHSKIMPRSGGLAVYASFVGVLVADLAIAWFIARHTDALPESLRTLSGNIALRLRPLAAILAGATMVFILGVIDDIHPLRPRTKLIVQILAVAPLLAGGVTIKFFFPDWIGWIITGFWVVLLTNSFNLLDNMDGLCSGVAAIASGVLALVSALAGEFYMACMFALLSGGLVGFLRYNFNPARIFLGDSGSLTIGYLLASLTVVATYYQKGVPTALPVLMPAIVLGVPLFDTISVMLIRWKAGKPLMQGDTNHFSHRLVRLGMTVRQAVLFIYLTTLTMGLAAIPLQYLPLRAALAQTGLIVLLFILIYLLERAGRQSNTPQP